MHKDYKFAEIVLDYAGEPFVVIPEDVAKSVGWKVGDTVRWDANDDGTWTVRRIAAAPPPEKVEMQYVLVETVQDYRLRYVVEVPIGTAWFQHAENVVLRGKTEEFSQKDLGERIISAHVIPQDQIIPLCDVDNDYAKGWNDEHKMNVFVTKWKDNKDA